MIFDVFPFLSFAIPTSISPGPNNISTMAFCMGMGYRKTFPYILGIAVGTFIIFLICAALSFGLSQLVPDIITYLKYIGAAYILYLAFKTSRLNIGDESRPQVAARFHDGLLLQLVNPKAIFYGMTIYSTFLQPLVGNKFYLTLSAVGLAMFTFLVVSFWGLFGTIIFRYLKNNTIRRIFAIVMASALVYVAIEILIK